MSVDENWMRCALDEASRCLRGGELKASDSVSEQPSDVPVGAVCVWNGEIVGRGHNRRELENDPTAHAEAIAIREAAAHLGRWRLDDVALYVTLEPCPMCAGAIWLARVARVVFGAWDARAGACGSLFDLPRDPRLNHRPALTGGVMEDECATLLQSFFREQRGG